MLQSSNIKADIAVRAEGLNLAYGPTTILKNIDLSLPRGQTLALLGPSGCGKTTLLRLVAGLLAPTKGSITINGITVADARKGTFVPPEKRHLGMVFQDYALWPHMTVFGNVSFPLEMRGLGRKEREKRVASALDRVGLAGFGERAISDMSGGQQQRVAIALVANLGLTAIYVTHDQSEAFSLADQVAVMRAGVIEQLASPEALVAEPTTPAVADFLRLGCVVPVEQRDNAYKIARTEIHIAQGSAAGQATHVLLPSRSVRSVPVHEAAIPATVLRSQFRGDGHLTTVRIGSQQDGHELTYLDHIRLSPGVPVGISVDASQLRWFSK